MNIPSLETILTDLDEARRQRNASNRRIEELTDALDKYKRAYECADAQILSLKEQRNRLKDERDGFGKAYHDAYMKTLELTAERDAALAENVAYYQLAKKEVWAVAESALREAKEALEICLAEIKAWRDDYEYDDFNSPFVNSAIANINKVLGEE